jgi:hypothetical protein
MSEIQNKICFSNASAWYDISPFLRRGSLFWDCQECMTNGQFPVKNACLDVYYIYSNQILTSQSPLPYPTAGVFSARLFPLWAIKCQIRSIPSNRLLFHSSKHSLSLQKLSNSCLCGTYFPEFLSPCKVASDLGWRKLWKAFKRDD